MATRVRLDQLITDRGLAPNRSRAQALLMAGRVRVGVGDAARLDRKPGDQVDPVSTVLELVESAPFVSRGGEKLAGALDAFGVDPAGRTCLDVGASTGGFTDCLLRRGATRVYALDVGRGQLAASLRDDPRVFSMERTHAARLDPDAEDPLTIEPVSLTVADVSFISLTRLLRGMAAATSPGGDLLPMVKPQFELTPKDVPGGVVRDPALRARAIQRVREHAVGLGLEVLGEVESPLAGPAGHQESILWLRVPAAA